MTSLAKLTSQSTQTLSLLLERQRLQTISSGPNNLHLPQITRNLNQLRTGILELESKEGVSEASRLLKSQYERMRGMLGSDADDAGIQSIHPPPPIQTSTSASSSSTSLPPSTTTPTPHPPPSDPNPSRFHEGPFAPYTDDPESGYPSNDNLLQTQRQMMDQQDVHLEHLSHSINRQHDLSLQINDELDVHTGLLEGLDEEVDRTGNRMSGARRQLDRFAKGAKENGSTLMIGLLIFVLLILIIIFKT